MFTTLMIIEVLAWIGLILSFYAVYVKLRVDHNKKFKALCDINDNISCSRAFTSFMPNPIIAVVFYLLVLLLPQFVQTFVIIGLVVTFYLAYLSASERNYCLICISLYLINVLLFVFI